MKCKIAISILFSVILLSSGWSCIQTTGLGTRAELEILNQELVRDQAGEVTVLVTIKNVGNVNAELAEVNVSFYDAQDNYIDNSIDSVLNLQPDEIWNFALVCESQRCGEVKRYEIEVMSGTSSGGF